MRDCGGDDEEVRDGYGEGEKIVDCEGEVMQTRDQGYISLPDTGILYALYNVHCIMYSIFTVHTVYIILK